MKISGIQIFWIMFTCITGDLMISTVGTAIGYTKQDTWISYLIAGIFGVLIIFAATKVSLLYPNQTLIEYSKTILGKWLGNIIIITYLIEWYSLIGILLRQFADFMITIMLPTTPIWILILTMLIAVIYVNYSGGIEGIGRCSEIFGPIIVLSGVVTTIFSLPEIEVHRILPILSESSFLSFLKGTYYIDSFIGESVMMMMFVSFMAQPKKGLSSAMWGVALSTFAMSVSALFVIMIFGAEVSAALRFPTVEVIKYLSVMGFIQNLEIVLVLVWILSAFILISLYFFMASYGTAQWLKIKDWRKTIWFVAVFSFVSALIYPNVIVTDVDYMTKYWLPFAFPVNIIGIPLLLWIVGSLRKKDNKISLKN